MSLVREARYDEVFDGQAHFRRLLDAMARPGKITTFEEVDMRTPRGLKRSTAFVCFALLNRDVSYYLSGGSNEIESYLQVNTGCEPVELDEADFVIVRGTESPDMLEVAKGGALTYPETGATVVVEVEQAAENEISDSIGLRLSGPGIAGETRLWVAGWQRSWAQALAEKNAEYPLGVDTILCFHGLGGEARVCCLPRSTKIELI